MPDAVQQAIEDVRRVNPRAPIVHAASPVVLDDPGAVQGRRVLVVEDGPTITHGGMPFGAGYVAAEAAGAEEFIDPRLTSTSELEAMYAAYPHIGRVLPAVGYSAAQLTAIADTINRSVADVVVSGTPLDLAALVSLQKPVVRARYGFHDAGEPRWAHSSMRSWPSGCRRPHDDPCRYGCTQAACTDEAAVRLVVALGGNALQRRGEPLDADRQRRNVARAAEVLATMAKDHDIVVTHGNGPQIGLLALQAAACAQVPMYPLDVLGAESEGLIGYMIEQELSARLPDREVATLLTQIEVNADDPAFERPTKPIGPVYERAVAERMAAASGWSIDADGDGWRRVVPSPEPRRILELNTIRLLVAANVIVVCSGGGGIPVVRRNGSGLQGVEAVIDKDLSAALLADALLLLTDVAAVFRDWSTARRQPIRSASPAQLREIAFPAGTMGPKVEAACRFVECTGCWAAIGALDDGLAVARKESGTIVERPRHHV